MKTTKLIPFLLCLVAAFSFTSCLDTDDDEGGFKLLEKADAESAFQNVRGSYDGNLIYRNFNANDASDETDTTTVSWSITNDSMLTIHDFPVRLLADHVSDDSVKKAIMSQPASDVPCYVGYYNLSPIRFLINPFTKSFTAVYGGETHKIQMVFLVNNFYSFGEYYQTDGELRLQIHEAAVYVDGVVGNNYLMTSNPFIMYGKKQ